MRKRYLAVLFVAAILTLNPRFELKGQNTLRVNLSSPFRPVTHCASGSLYGVTETLPADIDNLVAPLKPNVFAQPALSGSGRQQPIGAALTVSQRLVNTTAKVQIRLADVLPGWPYRWPGKTSFLNTCTSVINSKKASGRNNYDGYEIWNEPDGTWQAANGNFYTECWKPTYDLIRSLDPSARIIGPSYAYYNSTRMREFLTFCKNNNCLPEVISWHQWGSGGFVSAIDNYRALEASLGISPRKISINEYSSKLNDPLEGCPGFSVPFIAKFERKMVESACISWWFTNLPGRLGSLLTANNQKGGGWHLYKWYGDMTGNMVSVTPPNDNSDGIDGFACIDLDAKYASICLGGNYTGTTNVVINGIPSAFGSKVKVKLEFVIWTNKDTPVPGTDLISNTDFNVSNGSVTVPVNVSNPHYAYRIYITPGQSGVPSVKINEPIINSKFTSPAAITLSATATDPDGSVSNVKFYNGNVLLSTDNTSPYSFIWTNVSAGAYTIRAIATDNQGNTAADSVKIKVNVPRGPYGGTAHAIPGTIQAEEFDQGGNGFAYSDGSPGSQTGVAFRTDEDVDIETCTDAGGGYNIGWITSEEWLEYTVNVQNTGNYDLNLRLACNGTGRAINVFIEGAPVAANVAVPNTGGWQNWTTVSINGLELATGQKIMRISFGGPDYINLNYVDFAEATVTAVMSNGSSEATIYPNPFSTEGTQIKQAGNFHYIITDISGLPLEEGEGNDMKKVGSQLQPGIYFISIKTNISKYTQTIIKQ